jgi:predicted HTH domain antitoxin
MQLEIPDNLLSGIQVSEKELLLDLALGLFIDRRLSLARAAKVAGFNISAFMQELGKRKIPLHYGNDDLVADINTARLLKEERESYGA